MAKIGLFLIALLISSGCDNLRLSRLDTRWNRADLNEELSFQASRRSAIIKDGTTQISIISTYLNDVIEVENKNFQYFLIEMYSAEGLEKHDLILNSKLIAPARELRAMCIYDVKAKKHFKQNNLCSITPQIEEVLKAQNPNNKLFLFVFLGDIHRYRQDMKLIIDIKAQEKMSKQRVKTKKIDKTPILLGELIFDYGYKNVPSALEGEGL